MDRNPFTAMIMNKINSIRLKNIFCFQLTTPQRSPYSHKTTFQSHES